MKIDLGRISCGVFVVLWCLVAVFPLFWIVVMSFKLPVDAFASNPLQVMGGFKTLESNKGLSLLSICLWASTAYVGYQTSVTVTKSAIQFLQKFVNQFFAWITYSFLYLVVMAGFVGIVLPGVDETLNKFVYYIPILEYFSLPILGFTLEYYHQVWISNGFYENFLNSMTITVGVVTISLTIGIFAGYGLSRSGGNLAFWLLIVALIFRSLPHSVLVTGYLPIFLESKQLLDPLWKSEYVGWFFSLFSEESPSLYGKSLPVIIVLVAINQPFTIWMLRSFFMNVPRELDEAALVDGCSHLQALRKVVMPVMWPGVITTGLFSFLLAYNDYLVTSLLLDLQSQTMVPAITQYFNRETTATDQVEAIAAAVFIVIPLFFLVMIFQKQLVSGLTQGAVKD